MEQQIVSSSATKEVASGTKFIDANTISMSLKEVREEHIIPVFSKNNEPLISQTQFIETVQEALQIPFDGENILHPEVRVSHPIKGRVPDARHKAAKDLLPSEKTIYYERAIFKIDIPSITTEIEGQELCLSVGGVKAYNLDNIGRDSRSPQHFTLFIGFKNKICENLCVWSDGSVLHTTVTSLSDLMWKVEKLFIEFQYDNAVNRMKSWENIGIREEQFCQILGRARYYNCLPKNRKENIFPLDITDSQMMAHIEDHLNGKEESWLLS